MSEEIMSEDSEEYDAIDYTDEDNPADPVPGLAENEKVTEQELGALGEPQNTPKGYPDGQSMPALFGWITNDYQREIARELVELGKKENNNPEE